MSNEADNAIQCEPCCGTGDADFRSHQENGRSGKRCGFCLGTGESMTEAERTAQKQKGNDDRPDWEE